MTSWGAHPIDCHNPLRRVDVMLGHDVHDLQATADAFYAAVAELDLSEASPALCWELWALGDELERRTHALATEVAALLTKAAGDDGPDPLSDPLLRGEP